MKHTLSIALCITSFALGPVHAHTQEKPDKEAPRLEVEKWLTNKPETANKVVLIDFWATWCPPCRALIPELNRLQTSFKDDLVVVGLSDETEDKVRGFMGSATLAYSQAIDTKATIKNKLGVEGIPHVMVIDSTGIVRWQGFPQSAEDRLTEEVVRRIIDADKARRSAPTDPPDAPPMRSIPPGASPPPVDR